MKFIAPSVYERAFTCPHCGVLARQNKWGHQVFYGSPSYGENDLADVPLIISCCENCKKNCIWLDGTCIFPDRGNAPRPSPDMPVDVQADYEEAARIYVKSPRGAAALLRLAIQKLMSHLGQTGKNINGDIAALVATGLPQRIKQSLDIVRVTGNNAVHPGQLDANDIKVAEQLFPLVNLIIDYTISYPNRVQEIFDALPEENKKAIEKRDEKK